MIGKNSYVKSVICANYSSGEIHPSYFLEELYLNKFKASGDHPYIATLNYYGYNAELRDDVLCLDTKSERLFLNQFGESLVIEQPDTEEFRLITEIFSKIAKNPLKGFIKLKNANFRSASSPHAFGLLITTDLFFKQQLNDMHISVNHEIAHQSLFITNTLDRLVNNNFDNNLIHAQFQNKPRPPIGRLHSLVALNNMRMTAIEQGRYELVDKYSNLLEANLSNFIKGELTDFGQDIVNSVNINRRLR